MNSTEDRTAESRMEEDGLRGRSRDRPDDSMAEVRIEEITDERTALAHETLELIAASFAPQDRHPLSELRSEIAEKRLGLLAGYDFHLYAAVREREKPLAAVAGMYLAGVNAGFTAYLAVHPDAQGQGIAREVRSVLVDAFRENARQAGFPELAWVLGEVRLDSPWLRNLMSTRGAIPFDLTYCHPGMPLGGASAPYALYREPIGDTRREIPAHELRQVLYAVWRRGYRVRYPLERDTFVDMLEQLEGRDMVGPHPGVE
ncbi:hypothetical protein BH23GEM3_BH23GEM3_14470 [soil metagenome]